ncbi:MAG: type I restriction-modification enzyme R subunit C-terminal domain-containing protein [Candidatus Binatia bacterium]
MEQTPEQKARTAIDAMLQQAGWTVQNTAQVNLSAGRGVAIREFPLKAGYGFADYLLYINGAAAGVIEAKKEGVTLTGVETQALRYSEGLPERLPAHIRPLPFCYQSTGTETRFTCGLDPEPRSRQVFSFHRPETLAIWLSPPEGRDTARRAPTTNQTAHYAPITGLTTVSEVINSYGLTLRHRLRRLPPLVTTGLWPAQITAVHNLEHSLANDRPRALIQMATGSGKTFTAITSIYRLSKCANAKRVLFLVDRANLGRQALKEFQQYVTPDDGRKFTELYNVQHLTSNKLDPVARVCITTIQRLYSMLKGEEDLDPSLEEGSQFDSLADLRREPVPVVYNPKIPIETFDFIFTDECHRSIYNLWRQVLEYFDAYLIGLTATPSKQTLGFFNQNLVMEYNHEQAVADNVNVDFDVYRIRTQITHQGAKVEAGLFVDRRDRETRALRWERLDNELTYDASKLDRDVVAMDQIRTVIRTFKEKLLTEIFPGRTEVPKTLIYAKDDSHADDIVQVVREEFGKGNDFAQKITYKTGTARIVTKKPGPDGQEIEEVTYKSSGVKPEDLLSSFRNSYNPRIVVTVDMIATGTDIKPLEVVMFMRAVKSRNFFEQMKGRGVRVINDTDFQGVTPDAKSKTHFVIVDCVGACEQELTDSRPLERQPTVPLEKLLQAVAFGSTDPDILSSLAGRLARLSRQLGEAEQSALEKAARGIPLRTIAADIITSLDPDRQRDEARGEAGLAHDQEPSPEQVYHAAQKLMTDAVAPVRNNPALREQLVALKQRLEQTIDTVSKDVALEASFSEAARERARGVVASFEQFIEEHKDEITALQVLYSKPYAQRLRFADIKALAETIQAPPRAWTPEVLWRAYETLDQAKVRGSGGRMLTDMVSLVRFALHKEGELVPFAEQVEARFQHWLAQQENSGRRFTEEQRQWLVLMRDHIAASLGIEMDDFDYAPFAQKGGAGKVYQVFGERLDGLLDELNEVLAA